MLTLAEPFTTRFLKLRIGSRLRGNDVFKCAET
jgi:hypothetical protein